MSTCKKCKGTGVVYEMGMVNGAQDCPNCKGRGYYYDTTYGWFKGWFWKKKEDATIKRNLL